LILCYFISFFPFFSWTQSNQIPAPTITLKLSFKSLLMILWPKSFHTSYFKLAITLIQLTMGFPLEILIILFQGIALAWFFFIIKITLFWFLHIFLILNTGGIQSSVIWPFFFFWIFHSPGPMAHQKSLCHANIPQFYLATPECSLNSLFSLHIPTWIFSRLLWFNIFKSSSWYPSSKPGLSPITFKPHHSY
jgi:hypothetical protein